MTPKIDEDSTAMASTALPAQPCPSASLSSSTEEIGVNDDAHVQKQLHIAPMIRVSNQEFRAFVRILTRHATVWSEMVVDETLHFCALKEAQRKQRGDGDCPSSPADDSHVDDEEEEEKESTNRSTHDDRYNYTNLMDTHLGYDEAIEHPIVCQIGSNNPEYAYTATKLILQEYKYDFIDLNCECPSDKVAKRRQFGAQLMKQPQIAFDVLEQMQIAARECCCDDTMSRVSCKMRIGIDDDDSLEFMVDLIERLRPVCLRFILHARKVYLNGFMKNAHQNRTIPNLNYRRVYELCERFPDCDFWINGGISSLEQAKELCYGSCMLADSDDIAKAPLISTTDDDENLLTRPPLVAPRNLRGCMLGRAARDNPSILWNVDTYFYGADKNPCRNRRQVVQAYVAYLQNLYPRRCCDDDPRITHRIPAPAGIVIRGDCCAVCECVAVQKGTSDDPLVSVLAYPTQEETKISSHIIDRALAPIRGLFFQCPGNGAFRRLLASKSRDASLRNCGPAAILQMTLHETISDTVLDQPFA